PAYLSAGGAVQAANAREQCRWFGGMVGNHVADLVARYGEGSGAVPEELTGYIKDRQGYDYGHHGRAGNPDTAFVPDAVVDRFCLIGPVDAQLAKLAELRAAGGGRFAVYAVRGAGDGVSGGYAREVVPAGVERGRSAPISGCGVRERSGPRHAEIGA